MSDTVEKRFWAKVIKKGDEECWSWAASRHSFGYGYLWNGHKVDVAHRISYEIHKGNIPEGMLVCHTCDNPECTNPNHLFLGTRNDNNQDCMSKDRYRYGEGRKNTIYPDAIVRAIRQAKKSGISDTQLSKMFGPCRRHIRDIVNYETRSKS